MRNLGLALKQIPRIYTSKYSLNICPSLALSLPLARFRERAVKPGCTMLNSKVIRQAVLFVLLLLVLTGYKRNRYIPPFRRCKYRSGGANWHPETALTRIHPSQENKQSLTINRHNTQCRPETQMPYACSYQHQNALYVSRQHCCVVPGSTSRHCHNYSWRFVFACNGCSLQRVRTLSYQCQKTRSSSLHQCHTIDEEWGTRLRATCHLTHKVCYEPFNRSNSQLTLLCQWY